MSPDMDPPTSPMPPMPGGAPPPTAAGAPPGQHSGPHPTGAHHARQPAEQYGEPADRYGQHPQEPVTPPAAPLSTPPGNSGLAGVLVIGALVAVGLGVYGRLHEPTGFSINLAGFSSGAYAKAWLGSLAAALAIVQVLSAMVMYGKVLRTAPSWIGGLHRWSGRLAVLATVPVAIHCLFALGFEASSTRVLVHSLAGCLFYGAFVAKMLALTRPNLPSKALPMVGGLVFTGLIALWLTSSFWLFTTQGFKL